MPGVAPGCLGHSFSPVVMTYLALARKYRPKRFADLAGQAHVAAGLRGAVAKDRVAHAYLLTGPRGVGKTTAARILAMVLNCENRPTGDAAGEPCGACDSCRRIWLGGANLDVVEIDAASNRGVDDARDLRERATYAASGPGRHKVYIIDEAHMLTREAWNALLKILEEPPPRVVFLFATTEPQKIANTAAPVMSRVQRFDFRRLGPATITARLQFVAEQEGLAVEPDALLLIAGVAHGGMRDALSLLDQAIAFGDGTISAARVREALGLIDDETYAELLDLIAARATERVFPFVARLAEAGTDLAEFVGGAGETLRALLLTRLGGEPEGLTDVLREAVTRHAPGYTPGDVVRMLKLLGDAETSIRRSPNARLQVEMLLLHWTLLDRTVELQEVLDAARGGAASAGTPPPAGPRMPGRPRTERRADAPAPKAPRRSPAADAAEGDPTPEPPPAEAPAARAPDGPLTLETLRAAWPSVQRDVSRRRRLVGEALKAAAPEAAGEEEVVLGVAEASAQLEGLERSRKVIAEAIEAVTGHRVAVTLRPAGSPASREAPREPRRLDDGADRESRLRHYREKDPTLDAAAEALDLELLE
jgi:DNA polymerase-3 subunit gamma/tau